MAIDVAEYQKLKAKVDRARADADKAVGALDQMKIELKKEFDCDSLEDAAELLKKLELEEKAIMKEYEEGLAEFESQWAKYLKNRERVLGKAIANNADAYLKTKGQRGD